MQSHTHTLVRFGILQLSETKRPDYKASSCTTTQFGRIISRASIQRCSTRRRVTALIKCATNFATFSSSVQRLQLDYCI